jgi:energy-coupling factor transport system permease protein
VTTLPLEANAGSPPAARSIDARAWLIWAAGALIVALTAFHPWYQIILIGLVLLLWPGDSQTAGFLRLGMLIRLGLIALVFGAAFNGLIVRVGDTVLLHLPDSIPIIGGPIYAEAVVYGALNALRFVSILFTFALFSRSVNYADLLRLAPSAFFEFGLILSIGFTLAPSMLRAFNEIREAQALRGHRPRGVRDLLPLFTPLVISGMERALCLAESMEARGYGGGARSGVYVGQILTLLSLAGYMAILAVHTFAPLALPLLWTLLALNSLLLLFAVRQLSRAAGRTRLRRGHWGLAEWLIMGGALLPVIAMLTADRSLLVYDAYRMTALGLPRLDPWIAITLLGLALPAIR